MTMTVPDQEKQPLRCVVTSKGEFSDDLPLFNTTGGPIHILLTDSSPRQARPGVTLHSGCLENFLKTLACELAVNHLHCEGGGRLVGTLAAMNALDEIHLTLAGHTLFGGMGAPSPTGIPGDFLPQSLEFDLVHFEPQEAVGECFLSYRRRP